MRRRSLRLEPAILALVYTDGCSGYHVYDVYATDHDCLGRAHYGEIPNYIRYRLSEAGC